MNKFHSFWIRFIETPAVGKIRQLASLTRDSDALGTIASIRANADLGGANFWILFCGAMLASLGLDVNSAAVIIGAMLVSPLMSPILGIGLGVGINDKSLLLLSLRNFGFAVVISLITSIAYFTITPLGEITPEILTRTSPTILDVAIAFFGGVAGIVASSRRDKTNAIPGVAIATALMPPLCTSGFGIATGSTAILLGAFYLFFLNAVFISLSTYVVVRIMDFPAVEMVDKARQARIHRWIIVFVIIIMIPSAVIFYSVIDGVRIKKKIDKFIKYNVEDAYTNVLRWEAIKSDSGNVVKIFTAGSKTSDEKKARVESRFRNLKLEGYHVRLIHLNFTEEERQQITSEAASYALSTITLRQRLIESQQLQLDSLKSIVEKQKADSMLAAQAEKELRMLFPALRSLDVQRKNTMLNDTLQVIRTSAFVRMTRGLNSATESRIENFLKSRLKDDGLDVIFLRR